MTTLAWKLNRLRAMSAGELAHRGGRFVQQRRERRAVLSGSVPASPTPVSARVALFGDDAENIAAAWRSRFTTDDEALGRLLAGQVDFFAGDWLDVGTPVQWRRDPVTGIESDLVYGKELDYRDPAQVGDVKIVWELGRHQHLVPLAVAYAIGGDTRFRDAAVTQIEHWIGANPYGLGIHWCSALELALRLISWALVHGLLCLRDGAQGLFGAAQDPRALGDSIYAQTRFVRHFLSRYSSANNHLIGELTGLWVSTRVFDLGDEGERWGRFAGEQLGRESELQVHPDGVNREQAIYYHLWVLEYFLVAWLVGQRAGTPLSDAFRQRIAAMTTFLRDVTPPGGRPAQVGDADDGVVARFGPVWPDNPYDDVTDAVAAALDGQPPQTGKGFWYAQIHRPDTGATAVTAAAAVNKRTPRPAIYPEGGYAILGDAQVTVLFDAGPLGYTSIAAHGHADALSVCVALGSEWWLVDPGTYAYHHQPQWRDYFRSTRAHNTLTVDDRDQSQIGGPFLWSRHAHAQLEHGQGAADGIQIVRGEHDGYTPVRHSREVVYDRLSRRLTVTDEIAGDGTHDLAVCFHFAPRLTVTPLDTPGAWRVTGAGQDRIDIRLASHWEWEVLRGSERPILGWYSPSLGERRPAPTLRGTCRAPLPQRHSATLDFFFEEAESS